MSRAWTIGVLAVLAFLGETRLELFNTNFNLTVLVVYYAGLSFGATRGALTGAGIGIVADSLSGGMLGPRMLSLSTVGMLSANLRGGLFMWSPILGIIAVALFTLVEGYIAYACGSVFGQDVASMADVSRTLLIQSCINAAAGLFLRPLDEQQ